ncbi:hypothetical protein BV898_16175 [Hypsibius exemplaris]|uniref:Uncharacterized protein n=1 Tax=Hypsibius exemplaris TaxID=2072580 RepID=A0A9X6NCR4_HYPEX|nr:hypothetical protein BV898_16175 [Hypsibius exemplaris]
MAFDAIPNVLCFFLCASSGSKTPTPGKQSTAVVGPQGSWVNTDPLNLRVYLGLTASQKQDVQWNLIQNSLHDWHNLPTKFPNLEDPMGYDMHALFTPEYLKVSFEYEGDQMPGKRNRALFSPKAVVGKIKYNVVGNSKWGYTGFFKNGGIGIMRLALDGLSIPAFIPTGVFKIYLDGARSINFNLVRNVEGQKSNKNFFQNSFSNVIDRSPVDDKNVEAAFNATINALSGGPLDRPLNGFTLGLYEQASVNADGSKVRGPIVAPFEGRCKPNPLLRINPSSTNDFRVDIHNVVKPGMVLYTYWARRTPDSTVEEQIGEIVATSEFVASEYGDQKLFFRQPQRRWSFD